MSAVTEGFKAYLKGDGLNDNPYAEYDAQHDEWDDGWATGHDAKRYRWLRARDLGTINQGGIFVGKTPENFILNGIDLDEAIDSAME